MLRDALILLMLLNTVATVRLLLASAYSRRQKAWQVAIVWLLPLIGAIVVWTFTDADRGNIGPPRSSDAPPDRSDALSLAARTDRNQR